MKVSVEIEPPTGVYTFSEERVTSIEDEIAEYINKVEMLSITNRPVFGLSAITMAKRVHRIANKLSSKPVSVSLHLTTRLTHHDLFRNLLDAHRIGLSDILPILGDPRGPKDPNYFENGFDILGFAAYVKSGETKYLSEKYRNMLSAGKLVAPISDATFKVGSVIDLNPTKILNNGKPIEIRKRQIKLAWKKQKCGAEYLISQGIYDAQYYFDFIDNADLDIPIIVGLLPARTRLIEMFGIPLDSLRKQILRAQFTSKEEILEGNKMTRKVFQELEDGGCKSVHIYSIGNPNNFKVIGGFEDLDESHNRLNFEDNKKKQDKRS